jgi:hypothetical protein
MHASTLHYERSPETGKQILKYRRKASIALIAYASLNWTAKVSRDGSGISARHTFSMRFPCVFPAWYNLGTGTYHVRTSARGKK